MSMWIKSLFLSNDVDDEGNSFSYKKKVIKKFQTWRRTEKWNWVYHLNYCM